jgi:hypothetical protein
LLKRVIQSGAVAALHYVSLQALSCGGIERAIYKVVELRPNVGASNLNYGCSIPVADVSSALTVG